MFDFFKVQKVSHESTKVALAKDFENIPAISVYFKNSTGIDFEDQKIIFKSKVTSFCRTHKISSFATCLQHIQSDKILHQELTDYLTTNESYFDRELHQIEELTQKIKSSSKNVKILCAPSAHGEEPYSIVIALLSAGVQESRFHVTGIDISLNAIRSAQKAIYNEKAVRNLSQDIRKRYFTKKEDKYHLNQEVKDKVTFMCINIFESKFQKLQKFDYIFSRNMLIYFDTKTRLKAQSLFKSHLVDENEEIYYGHADLTHLHH